MKVNPIHQQHQCTYLLICNEKKTGSEINSLIPEFNMLLVSLLMCIFITGTNICIKPYVKFDDDLTV